MTVPFLVGNAAGFSGDRVDAAAPVVATLLARRRPAALTFETLAERTLALGQLARRADADAGHEPMLEALLAPVLADCVRHAIPIIGNFGAANPRAAARRIARLAGELGMGAIPIAIIEGDDVRHLLAEATPWEGDPAIAADDPRLVSANAYLGAFPIAAALRQGARVVVTGRCADPALTLGPLIAHHGWDAGALDRLAAGTLAGHLLECGAQVTGGYFAHPGIKDVPRAALTGFPIAEVTDAGAITITKADHTGGRVCRRTVIEQLLYEIHDPAAYLTPDVTLDITHVAVAAAGPNRVSVSGARGHPPPATLKATVSLDGGVLAEGEIGYAGPGAFARARLAADTLRRRPSVAALGADVRIDILGQVALHDGDDARLAASAAPADPDGEFRVRLAARAATRKPAEAASREVLALYCCGPAGGGGVRLAVTPRIATVSALVPAARVSPTVAFLDA
jgi:hypothetical protein